MWAHRVMAMRWTGWTSLCAWGRHPRWRSDWTRSHLSHKPTGVRTLGLVAVGAAVAVTAVVNDRQADISRVIQGVITGVGFIGAGVICTMRPTGRCMAL